MKKRNLIFLFVSLFVFISVNGQTDRKAKSILDNASLIYSKSTVKVNFKMTIQDTKLDEKAQLIEGELVMKGSMFKLTVPNVQTYYDGENQYVYMMSNNEVSITVPSNEELEEINPALMLKSYKKSSAVQFSLDNKSNLSYYVIDVFPEFKSKKTYYKSILKIDKKTKNILSIKVLSQNGIHSTFEVTKFTSKLKVADKFFKFDLKANPTVVVNDLR